MAYGSWRFGLFMARQLRWQTSRSKVIQLFNRMQSILFIDLPRGQGAISISIEALSRASETKRRPEAASNA